MDLKRVTSTESGFTLMELVLVIIMIGVISGVALRTINSSLESAHHEQTKREMDELSRAIVGDPTVYTSGSRSDFGYVGDVGALPPNLDALVQNPGGFATWDGPYMTPGFETDGFKKDAWAVDYTYNDTLIRSTGSGANIDKVFAGSTAELLSNRVEGNLADADQTRPGTVYADSILVRLTYPDGGGAMAVLDVSPNARGYWMFGAVPVGNHELKIIYTPASDTVTKVVTVYPARDVRLNIVFPADLW